MIDWLLNLPPIWMALIIFTGTYLTAAIILAVVTGLARGERARAFKALSPGMLPPLGIIFGLLVGFIAAQVWSDFEKAKIAVVTEASALRSVLLLAESFPGDQEARLRALVGEHIDTCGQSGMARDGESAGLACRRSCATARGSQRSRSRYRPPTKVKNWRKARSSPPSSVLWTRAASASSPAGRP